MKPGQIKILSCLLEHEQGLTFTELKAKTKLSAPALSDYLKSLQDEAIITKLPDRKYSLRGVFKPIKKLSDREKAMKFFTTLVLILGPKIKKIKDPSKRLELVRQFVKIFVFYGVPFITWATIHESFEKSKKRKKNLWSILNVEMENWLNTYVQKITLIFLLNVNDMRKTEDMIISLYDLFLDELTEFLSQLRERIRDEGLEDEKLNRLFEALLP